MTASFSLLLSPHFLPFPFSSKNSHSFLTVILKDRPPPWYDAVYVPPHHRLRSGISSARSHFSISSLPHFQTEKQLNNKTDYNINHDNNDNYNNFSCNDNSKISQSISAYSDGVSEEESDRELEMSLQPGASPSNNIEDWRWKLTILLCNKEKQGLISREKNDRRDFEQISALASSMGLYSHLYAKVVVFSKVPLPNYRFDLDDRRPLRERRGRAGCVQPGECYHLYPRCVYDAFPEYQLSEILRTPLQSLYLQTKSLRLGSISKSLSRALQSPEFLAVENAIEYLKINWDLGPE